MCVCIGRGGLSHSLNWQGDERSNNKMTTQKKADKEKTFHI